jgi:hypothetical protein
VVLTSISNAALSGAVYSVNLGNTVYATSRGGESLTQIDITAPASMSVKPTPLNMGAQLTGLAVASYPALFKVYAFVAGSSTNSIYVVDVTLAAAMSIVATITNAGFFNYPSNVVMVGTTLFVTSVDTPAGIAIVNVTAPLSPVVQSFTSAMALGLSGTQRFDHLFIDTVMGRGYQSDTSTTGGVYVLQLLPQAQVATPALAPPAGSYDAAQSVSISSTTPYAAIRFTTDGSTPTETYGTVYVGPIGVLQPETITAIAYRTGWTDSAVVSAEYNILLPGAQSGASQQPTGVGTNVMIPLTNSPNQSVTVSLPINGGSLTLNLEIYYNENGENGDFWSMDVSDQNGNLLVASVPLVTGAWPAANVLAPFDYLRIGSAYMINASGGSTDIPDSTTLGAQFLLIWGPN